MTQSVDSEEVREDAIWDKAMYDFHEKNTSVLLCVSTCVHNCFDTTQYNNTQYTI